MEEIRLTIRYQDGKWSWRLPFYESMGFDSIEECIDDYITYIYYDDNIISILYCKSSNGLVNVIVKEKLMNSDLWNVKFSYFQQKINIFIANGARIYYRDWEEVMSYSY